MNEIEKYSKKAISARLQNDELEYFFKFAQENKTDSISDTFNLIINRLNVHEPMEAVTFEGTSFHQNDPVNENFKEKYLTKPKKKLSIARAILQPEPEPEPEAEPEEEKEDVFEI